MYVDKWLNEIDEERKVEINSDNDIQNMLKHVIRCWKDETQEPNPMKFVII